MKDFIIPDRDFGTPAAKSKQMVTLSIDGFRRDSTGRHVDHAGGGGGGHFRCRNSAPPTAVDAFGSCRLCLVEIEGRNGTPGLLHHSRLPLA